MKHNFTLRQTQPGFPPSSFTIHPSNPVNLGHKPIYWIYRGTSGLWHWSRRRFTVAVYVWPARFWSAADGSGCGKNRHVSGVSLLLAFLVPAFAGSWFFRARFAVTRSLPRLGPRPAASLPVAGEKSDCERQAAWCCWRSRGPAAGVSGVAGISTGRKPAAGRSRSVNGAASILQAGNVQGCRGAAFAPHAKGGARELLPLHRAFCGSPRHLARSTRWIVSFLCPDIRPKRS